VVGVAGWVGVGRGGGGGLIDCTAYMTYKTVPTVFWLHVGNHCLIIVMQVSARGQCRLGYFGRKDGPEC